MFKEKMEAALNDQINAELYSAYLYLSMAAYFEKEGLKGFSNWMRVQSQEEVAHAMKFYNFITERGGVVKLTAVEQPKQVWKDTEEALADTLKHEQYITERIYQLVSLSREETDPATEIFLQWFVNEQVEEESSAEDLISTYKLAGGKGGALYHMDKELAQRVFVPPTTE